VPEELAAVPEDRALDESDRDEVDLDEVEFTRPDIPSEQDLSPTETETPAADEQPSVAEPKAFALSSIEEDDLDLELANAALNEDAFPEPSPQPENLPEIDDFDSESTQWHRATVNVTAKIDQDFEKLQLRDRFWQKLSLLTQDGYRQSLEVKRALQPSEPLSEGNHQSNEFVVYEPPRRSRWSHKAEEQKPADPIQVMPPILDVPQEELIAGEWLAIKVRIPAGDYQPYVKVWMNDLQTRTIIDSPRLLMQFVPNDNNELETLMRVQIPQGCLELQFAAISIDMATLQESRKVVQNRRVMPPDDSLSVFDDWDI
jgi:hypothetical protein